MLVAYRTIPTFAQEFQKRKRNPLPLVDVRCQVAQDWRVSKVLYQNDEEKIARIRGMFDKVKLSVSSYDTAWLAMVPSPNSEEKPLFPQCLDWVMNHQHPDGSWSIDPFHPLLLTDSLSSTLACVLALQKWKVGDLIVERALNFIEKNLWAATDKRQLRPIGFEIVFPGMLEHAVAHGLRIPVDSTLVNTLLHKRDNEITRCHREGNASHLTYLLEGLITKYDWKEAKKHQRRNGSLFNSPSATAASLIQRYDDRGHHYLNSILKKYKDAVPTIYPLDIYINLYMIDTLQKLGIDRYFTSEIESALNTIYRHWLQRDEDIFLDVNCCAMGFRLLRMSGYDISSDDLTNFKEQNDFFSSVSAQYKNINTILELHKASQVTIYQKEPVLEEIMAWTSSFLRHELQSGTIQDRRLRLEVQHALNYKYDSLNRIDSRRNIELMEEDHMQLLKTSYSISNINNKDLLSLSVHDYNMCQSLFRQELGEVQRWVKDNRLDQAKYARSLLKEIHFFTSAISFAPELSNVRVSKIINSFLTVVVDDFFDHAGSIEELENLVTLFERWEENSAPEYCSEDVELIFSALKNSIKDFGTTASLDQGRDVTRHLVQIWRDLLKAMMKEAKWAKGISLTRPTMEEYMENGYVSFALGPVVLIPLYFFGSKLSEKVVSSAEYHTLFKLMSLIARLLNDLVTMQKEIAQGKLNSVSLQLLHDQGTTAKGKAIEEVKKRIEDCRKELLRLVVQRKGSIVPRACKDFFMGLSNTVHYCYQVDEENDGFSSPYGKVIEGIKAVVWEPIALPHVHGH